MKASEIKVGSCYTAKVNGKLVTVRVDKIMEPQRNANMKSFTGGYRVTNLSTGRKTIFRSAAKFRTAVVEDKQGSDPTQATPSSSPMGQSTRKSTAGTPAESNRAVTTSTAPTASAAEYTLQTDEIEEIVHPEHTADRLLQEERASRVGKIVRPRLLEDGLLPTPAKPAAAPAVSPLGKALKDSIVALNGQADTAPHIEVQALAGTGKTTTVIEGCKVAKGLASKLTPSDQQRAVWEAIEDGRHGTIRISSFASKITDELKRRVEEVGLTKIGVEARGIHSLGLQAATSRFGRLDARSAKWVVPDIVCGLLGKDIRAVKGTPDNDVVWAVDSLVSLCKQTLSDPTAENLDHLSSRYDVDVNGSKDRIYGLVAQTLDKCLVPQNGRITFDDMIWLPLKHDLPIAKVDLQIIDESQDLNRMQQELMYKAGHRLLFVGDKNQAIFGFAGADSDSMDHMREHLAGGWYCDKDSSGEGHHQYDDSDHCGCCGVDRYKIESRNCVTMPLTVTRRCGKAIVTEAQKYVPEYEAHESNPEGRISQAGYEEGAKDQYRSLATAGDFVLCRVNAPLVSQCFRFIKAGRRATILGKDIGEGLVTLVTKSKRQSVPDLVGWLSDWLAKETANENAKRYPSEGRIENLTDRHDCIMAFTEGLSEVADVLAKINSVFTDNKDEKGISLSSIHKAKGLEARRVFLLQPKGVGPRMDKMQDWELQQERNLGYVAITRAIEELTYVS